MRGWERRHGSSSAVMIGPKLERGPPMASVFYRPKDEFDMGFSCTSTSIANAGCSFYHFLAIR